MNARSETVTILFTDLVESTQLMQRAGDADAQRVFRAHHALLSEAVGAHGGEEVKWLGDGLMVAFPSAVDAVSCAIRMQQASRRPAAGERLRIRVGLHVGDTLRDETDYFGTSVVIARRLCDHAQAGQILASESVRALLTSGADFRFAQLGPLALKGLTEPVAAVEVRYEHDLQAMLARTPFIGRKTELAVLRRLLHDVRSGQGAVAVLSGEPGVGKTRLTEELCEHARAEGARLLYGRCYESDSPLPFGPFIEALRAYLLESDDAEPPQAAEDREYLRLLVSGRGLSRSFFDPSSETDERFRIIDALQGWLAGLARRAPVVFVLDDLHWADHGTIAMLRHSSRAFAAQPLLLLCTYRDVEVSEDDPLAGLLAALRRDVRMEQLPLKGLAAEDVGELLSIVTDQEADADLARELSRETGGNPLFLREMLLHLTEEGWRPAEGAPGAGPGLSLTDRVPAGVRDVIARRLSRLSAPTRRLLAQLSAFRRPFSWPEIRAASGESDELLFDAIDEALQAQLLTEHPPGTYDFAHAQIRTAVYSALASPRRYALHRHMAELLASVHADDVDRHAAEIADHWLAAGPDADTAKIAEFARLGADQLIATTAYEDAGRLCERALAAIDTAPAAPLASARGGLLIQLGDALLLAGAYREAQRAFGGAFDLARQTADTERMARAALGYETARFAHSPILRGKERDRVLGMLQEAVAAVGEGDSALRARLLARQAWSLPVYEADARQALSEEALRIAERLGDHDVLLYVTYARHQALWQGPETVRQRADSAEEIIRVATMAGDRERTLLGHYVHMHAMLELGQMQAADEDIAAFTAIAHELRRPQYVSWASVFAAMRAFDQGKLAEAEALARDALAAERDSSDGLALQMFGAQMFAIRREQADLAGLRPAVEQWSKTNPDVRWSSALAVLYAELDLRDEARAEFDAMIRDFYHMPHDSSWVIATALLSEVCVYLEDTKGARTLYDVLAPFSDRNVVVGHAPACAGSVSRYLGLLAALLSRHADAEQHFLDALTAHEKMGARVWVAHTCHDYAALLAGRGQPADQRLAAELIRRARVLAAEMGLRRLEARIERLAAAIPGHALD